MPSVKTLIKIVIFISPVIFLLYWKTPKKITIEIENGAITGKYMTSAKGSEFLTFMGIPYAEPPEGDLRFKPPVPKKSWKNEILDATSDVPFCTQINLLVHYYIEGVVMGQDDCLYLNVFTPNISPKNKFPVLVWIHGGAFQIGNGGLIVLGPNKLMDHEIVVVTLNYRLDALGFLSTGDNLLPGNYGLLDQLEALKWVKRNIGVFGGDPDKITLGGQSAGGASVMHLMLSPLSQDLFHQVIVMSPSCVWEISKNPLSKTKILAQNLECPIDDNIKMVECIKTKPSAEIIRNSHNTDQFGIFGFLPTIDGYLVLDTVNNLLSRNKIPKRISMLTGTTKDEGVGLKILPYSEHLLKKTAVEILNIPAPNQSILDLLKEEYVKKLGTRDDIESTKTITKMMSDGAFDVCYYQQLKYLIATGMKIYNYRFEYDSETSLSWFLSNELGVAHCDDLLLLFDGYPNLILPKNDVTFQVEKRILHLWTNFIKHGVPTINSNVTWPELSPGNIKVYYIRETDTVEKFNLDEQLAHKFDFWLKQIPQVLNKTDS